MPGSRVAVLAGALASYVRIAWWGLVAPRITERESLVVVQAVVIGREGILLAIRSDLQGWELPGGTVEPGENAWDAMRREIREETGLEVGALERVGDYERTGFRPHTARVFRCRVTEGELATGDETLELRWFAPDALPDTLFPWYRAPIDDALAEAEPCTRREHQGLRAISAGMRIDLRTRMQRAREGRRVER